MRSIRVLAAAAALLTPLAFTTTPANAGLASEQAVVQGAGTISPGLPTQGCEDNQAIYFEGDATANGTHGGNYHVVFNGSSGTNCESLQSGAGTGTLSGTGITGTVSYQRTGNIVTLSGSGAVNGVPHTITSGVCVFGPTNAGPVTTYTLVCVVVLSD